MSHLLADVLIALRASTPFTGSILPVLTCIWSSVDFRSYIPSASPAPQNRAGRRVRYLGTLTGGQGMAGELPALLLWDILNGTSNNCTPRERDGSSRWTAKSACAPSWHLVRVSLPSHARACLTMSSPSASIALPRPNLATFCSLWLAMMRHDPGPGASVRAPRPKIFSAGMGRPWREGFCRLSRTVHRTST